MKSLLTAAALSLALATAANAATTVVHAGHLIAEPGKPVTTNQSIIIENGRIVAIKDGFVAGDTVIDLKDSWVMPGLIDMHTHVSGQIDLNQPIENIFVHAYMARQSELVLDMLPTVKTLLMNGFTSVRNVGDPTSTTYDLRNAINKGSVIGPRMFAVEPQIAVAGGEYDPSKWGVRKDLEQYVTSRGVCSGVEQCIRVVREEVARGADVIKVRQVSSPFEDPKIQTVESPEEMNAIISTAHKLNRTVAVHVSGAPDGVRMAIEAGADTIEHGPVNDANIALMKQHGTALTPTLLAAKLYTQALGGARDLYKEDQDGVRKAYKAGVMITFGTDLGIFGPERSWEEFGLLHDAGLPPEQALRTATVNAAIKLGKGDSLGSIAPGKIADVIALKADPIADLGAMKTISFVMKEGQVFKNEP
jgi:imidazolonepropionase-like amidohydrolase